MPDAEHFEEVFSTQTCRVYDNQGTQITHLVRRNERGGTPGDTLCGLSRFDREDKPADLPGWSMGGGVFGPNVKQVDCEACHALV